MTMVTCKIHEIKYFIAIEINQSINQWFIEYCSIECQIEVENVKSSWFNGALNRRLV